jgi:hypothetical protein
VVVADLYNMAVISHKHFTGHPTLLGHFIKISAYADDMVVHLSTLTDIRIYRLLLKQYALATLEAVLCGSWRKDLPDLRIKVAQKSTERWPLRPYTRERHEFTAKWMPGMPDCHHHQ